MWFFLFFFFGCYFFFLSKFEHCKDHLQRGEITWDFVKMDDIQDDNTVCGHPSEERCLKKAGQVAIQRWGKGQFDADWNMCGCFGEKCPHRFMCFNTLSLVGGIVRKKWNL